MGSIGGGGSIKCEGEVPLQSPVVAEPRPAVLRPSTLSSATMFPFPISAGAPVHADASAMMTHAWGAHQ